MQSTTLLVTKLFPFLNSIFCAAVFLTKNLANTINQKDLVKGRGDQESNVQELTLEENCQF